MSEPNEPGPTHTPYGQDPYGPPPTSGQNPYGQQPTYGQGSYGQGSYGQQQPATDRRPGTVTAAAWITIVFSALTALLFGLTGLALVVARDEVINEIERVPEFQDANIDADTAVGVLVAVILGLVVWAIIAIVLAVFVLRRSNVSRILLVISSAVVALLSLLGVTSGISLITLVAALGVIVLLFVGGANDWFKRTSYAGDASGYGQQHPAPGQYGAGGSTPNPYGQQDQPNPYGQQNPYGSSNTSGESGNDGQDGPPRDYPGR